MPEVFVKKGESVDRALKRLKNKLETEGIMEEVRRLRAFETPNARLKRKARANAKRARFKVRFTLADKPSASDDAS
jgi:small subunit ribosomal protein S21